MSNNYGSMGMQDMKVQTMNLTRREYEEYQRINDPYRRADFLNYIESKGPISHRAHSWEDRAQVIRDDPRHMYDYPPPSVPKPSQPAYLLVKTLLLLE